MKALYLALTVVLVSSASLVSTQDVQQVTVGFQKNLTLTCDFSAYSGPLYGPLNVSWETMGNVVIQYDDDGEFLGPLFQDRVTTSFDGMELSFTLSPVVLSDADVYECLWNGRKTLSTVIVTVLESDYIQDTFFRREMNIVELPCFGKISKSATLEKVSVYWKRNGEVVYSLIAGKPPNPPSFKYNNAFMDPDKIHKYGDLSLTIYNLTVKDSGTYECLYRDNNFSAEVHGIPKSVELAVEQRDNIEDETEPFYTSFDLTYVTPTPNSAVKEQPSLEGTIGTEEDSQTAEDSLEMQGTSVPETGAEEAGAQLPWVLIGIISGALIITALVLGPLVAMGKI